MAKRIEAPRKNVNGAGLGGRLVSMGQGNSNNNRTQFGSRKQRQEDLEAAFGGIRKDLRNAKSLGDQNRALGRANRKALRSGNTKDMRAGRYTYQSGDRWGNYGTFIPG